MGDAARLRRWRLAVLLSLWGLIGLLAVMNLAAWPHIGATALVVWLLQSAPLLMFAPALHPQRPRRFLWLGLLVLPYFAHAVLMAFDPTRWLFGLLDIALCGTLFLSLIMVIRLGTRPASRRG